MHIKHWLHQLLVAVDQLINVLVTPFQGGAWADETLSSRAWRMDVLGRPWGRFWRPVIDALFIWQGKGHCERAFLSERSRAHAPPETRVAL
jgi:hypothetical protein